MSLLYKLFGKPQTIDEFVDLIKWKRESHVEITLRGDSYHETGGMFSYICRPVLQAGRYKFKLGSIRDFVVLGYERENQMIRDSVDAQARENAHEIGEKLKQNELNVSYKI